MDYYLTSSSTADLSVEYFEKIKVKPVYFNVVIDDETYVDDLGETLKYKDFYERVKNGSEVSTSQVNTSHYVDFFTPMLEEGKDIVHIELSSGLSGSVNSCNIAKEILEEKFPDRKIYVIDSLNASSGIGIIVDKLATLRDEGYSAKELYEWGKDHVDFFHSWVYCSDLTQYVRGGRISKASGFIGGLLSICPILKMTLDGRLVVDSKVRTRKKAREHLLMKMEEYIKDGYDYSGKIFISHSNIIEDALDLKEMILEKYPKVEDVVISYIGTTIGSHTGQGTIALFFEADKKKEEEKQLA